jgi:hypothetical protein
MKRFGQMIVALGIFLLAQVAQADWTPAKRLTWTAGASVDMNIISDSSGKLHLVWADSTPGNLEIYYKKSINGGTTWSANKRLTWTAGDSRYPASAADPFGGLHVVWYDDTPGNAEIYYSKSTDGGATWSPSKRLTWTVGNSFWLALAVDSSGYIHVVWSDPTPGNAELYYKKSMDGGSSWTASKRLTWTSELSSAPDIAVDSSNSLYVVWHDMTPGNLEIYCRKSPDGGATWTSSQRLTLNSGDSLFPDIVRDSAGNLHVVWEDFTPGKWEIYYKKSTNGGISWSASKRITWTSGTSWWPAIAIDSAGNLLLVWQDDTPGGTDIYYGKSPDGGATWNPFQRLTWTLSAGYPDLTADPNGNHHLVYNIGNTDIYYKKGT